MSSSLVSLLEADFRNLAQDARKADGIAGFFTSAPNPEVKEAAERAVLRVCSFAEHEDPIGQVRAHSKVSFCENSLPIPQLPSPDRSTHTHCSLSCFSPPPKKKQLTGATKATSTSLRDQNISSHP